MKEIILKFMEKFDASHISRTLIAKGYENDIIQLTSFLDNVKLSQRIWHILNDLYEYPKCLQCNKEIYKFRNLVYGYNKFCSQKCGTIFNEEKRKQTKQIKYGNKTYNNPQKAKETSLQKYGVEHFNQLKSERKRNSKNCQLHLPEIEKQVRKTWLKRYGVEHPSRREDYKRLIYDKTYDKLYDLVNEKYEVLFTREEFKGVTNTYRFKCKKCKKEIELYLISGKLPRCLSCYPYNTTSIGEEEIKDYISSLGIKYICNDKSIISPYELDIYIPEKKIAIEYNGLYWHSEAQGKDKKYHLNKTIECEKQNIQLIHIFEDEWTYKQSIVKTRLKHILKLNKFKIYGRKCSIVEIDNKIKNRFLDKYHIQGKDTSSIKLGAKYNGKLVSVMTFGKRRVCMGKKESKEGEYELLRFASVSGISVIGIAGKLLKYFERNYNPSKLISYADRRWSKGHLYYQLGFRLLHYSNPSYFYFNEDKRLYRFNFRKNVLKDKLEYFDKELTEVQNMYINGYNRIFDCGCMVFEKYYE